MRSKVRNALYEKNLQFIKDIWDDHYIVPKYSTKTIMIDDVLFRFGRTNGIKSQEEERLRSEANDYIFDRQSQLYVKQLESRERTIDDITRDVWQVSDWVIIQDRLWSFIDSISEKYVTPDMDLKRIAGNNQNVHAVVVRVQELKTTKILEKFPIPEGQSTLNEIMTAWANDVKIGNEMLNVYEDMKKWAKKSKIDREGDYLYKVLLRGAWAKIKTYRDDIRVDLVKRLWEECSEAVGMCATGHISRITNVFVGYDDAFLSPVSSKETFQNRISEISQMDVSFIEKTKLAKDAMDEANIIEEERQSWLDALED